MPSQNLLTLRAAAVLAFHDACLTRPDWPTQDQVMRDGVPSDELVEVWSWVLVNHRFNCSLWAEEDLARRTLASDADIAANKRNIDRFNQARNDAMERIDDALLQLTQDWPRHPDARLSSETAGAMIDRLSILSLKVHHMGLQTVRTDVDAAHRHTMSGRHQQLQTQRKDLAGCLDRLLDELSEGRGFFRIYRQFKMYNDPKLNPALVAEGKARAQG
jgi:hypothetical protein